MIVGLASPSVASSLDDGLEKIETLMREASRQAVDIVCFPVAYLPGLRGQDFDVLPFDETVFERVLVSVRQWAERYKLAVILGTELLSKAGRQIQGYQTKNQLDPTEDRFYVPGDKRELFEIKGTKFGIAICHEGFRYPET